MNIPKTTFLSYYCILYVVCCNRNRTDGWIERGNWKKPKPRKFYPPSFVLITQSHSNLGIKEQGLLGLLRTYHTKKS